jgi:hypothetical protein
VPPNDILKKASFQLRTSISMEFYFILLFFFKKKKKKKEKRKKGMRDLRVESTKDSREMKTRNSASY